MKASPYPTFRYILLQGSYWFSFCVTYCFISVFLLSYGFTNTQIGLIIAIAGLVSAILQPVLGGLINEEGRITMRRTLILLVVSILIFSLFIIIFNSHSSEE